MCFYKCVKHGCLVQSIMISLPAVFPGPPVRPPTLGEHHHSLKQSGQFLQNDLARIGRTRMRMAHMSAELDTCCPFMRQYQVQTQRMSFK